MSIAAQILDLCEDYKFSSTQFPMPDRVKKFIKSCQSKVDPEDWTEEDGKEDDIHLTLLYGITGGNRSKKLVQKFLDSQKPVKVRLSKMDVFPPKKGRDYEVLIVRVKGQGLHRLRAGLEKAVPNDQTWPDYKPHVTIGYVKKGTASKYDFQVPDDLEFELDQLDYSTKTGRKTRMRLGASDDKPA